MATYQSQYTGAQIDQAIGAALNPDTTLSQAGKTADAKAAGDSIANLQSEVDGIIDEVASKNILDPSTIIEGKTFNNTGLIYDATSYFVAGDFAVEYGEKLYLYAKISTYYANIDGKLLFIDNNGNIVDYIATVVDYNGNTGYDVPEGATKVKISTYKTYKQISLTKEKVTEYIPYSTTAKLKDIVVQNSNIPYKTESLLFTEAQSLTSEQKQQAQENIGLGDPAYTGKKVLFLGDSITRYNLADNGWCKYFNEIMKVTKSVNVAVSGAVWSDYADTVYDGDPNTNYQTNNTIGNQVEKIVRGKDTTHPNYSYVADYAEFDIIIIAAGTNDGNSKFSEEDIRPSLIDTSLSYASILPLAQVDKKKACGAMRYAYETLYALYPDARFYYCTPIQTYPTKKEWGETLNKGDVIKAMCRYLPVHVIDTEHCGIYGWREQYNSEGVDLIDGLHPSQSGAIKIGTYNANEVIKTYIPY